MITLDAKLALWRPDGKHCAFKQQDTWDEIEHVQIWTPVYHRAPDK